MILEKKFRSDEIIYTSLIYSQFVNKHLVNTAKMLL